jgi:CheY-like chemotaxis protein
VLVAEHHDDTRQMLKVLLTTHGFDAVECGDAEAAVAEATRFEPDVLLLDGSLPGGDALGVAARLTAADRPHRPRIVFVSAYAGADLERRARAAGCDSFMLKPVSLEDLVDVLQQLTAASGAARGVR